MKKLCKNIPEIQGEIATLEFWKNLQILKSFCLLGVVYFVNLFENSVSLPFGLL